MSGCDMIDRIKMTRIIKRYIITNMQENKMKITPVAI